MDYNNHDPGIKYILHNFEKFNNTKILLGGRVTGFNVTNHEISFLVPVKPWYMIVKVPSDEELPQVGDHVEIYGLLDGRTHVTAERILVSSNWENNLIYYRSYLAIPFVLFIFFRIWRFNIKKFMFERRVKDA
jgi:hypothetical protein